MPVVPHVVASRLQGAKREEIKQRAIDALRSAAAIVDQKAPSEAAAATKPG